LQPLEWLEIRGGYDWRDHASHWGVDYASQENNQINASSNGVVVSSSACTYSPETECIYGDGYSGSDANYGYGNVVIIEYPYSQLPAHIRTQLGLNEGQSLYFLYAHLSSPSSLLPGQAVFPGTEVGAMGTTGISTGPHLHFEVRIASSGGNDISKWFWREVYTPINPHRIFHLNWGGEYFPRVNRPF
jgi:murein DD-endopeptidase MepM/ murein hydrolase activator NlpD